MSSKAKTVAVYTVYYGLIAGIKILDFLCYATGRGSVAAHKLKNKIALHMIEPKKNGSPETKEQVRSTVDWEFEEVFPLPVDGVDSRPVTVSETSDNNQWDGEGVDRVVDTAGSDKPTQTKLTAVINDNNDQNPETNDQDKPTAA